MKKLRLLIPIIIIVMLLTGCSSSKFDDELAELRQDMEENLMSAGVAYLGSTDKDGADDYIKNVVPKLCKDIPFTSKIPSAKIIGEGGDLYCVVTNDKKAEISVIRCDEYADPVEEIYKSRGDVPLLIFANNTGFTTDTMVSISQSDGTVAEFRLELDGYGRFWADSNTTDFSPYDELLKYHHDTLKEQGYTSPTVQDLVGTTWSAQLLFMHDIWQNYSIEFMEDTVNIKWNTGFDEGDRSMTTPCTFEQKDGVFVMSLPLGELGGTFNGDYDYALLLNDKKDSLFITADYTVDHEQRYSERFTAELKKK